MSNSPDQALIERCQRGDRNALEKLVGKYEGPVYNASFRFLGNSEDAADVIVFLASPRNRVVSGACVPVYGNA